VQARPIAPTGPFVVHESDAALTVPEDLQLATDTRAAGRAEFDAHVAEKMQQEEVGVAGGTPSLPHASWCGVCADFGHQPPAKQCLHNCMLIALPAPTASQQH